MRELQLRINTLSFTKICIPQNQELCITHIFVFIFFMRITIISVLIAAQRSVYTD